MGTVNLKTASGGSVILSPANTAVDTTITVPAISAPMAINGPAFSAYQSTSQTALSAATDTKILFQTEEYDTASAFDNITNSRFQPTLAGYYQVNANVQVIASASSVTVSVFKNGSKYKSGVSPSGNTFYGSGISTQVYLNGTTDYIEIYANFGVSQQPQALSNSTWFQAAMVRSA